MPPTSLITAADAQGGASIGALIREWRTTRRLSQMELALDVGISPRHLSFVETGRSRPSAELLMALADQMEVPMRTRNLWLLASGYAPRYAESPLDSQRMHSVRAALQRLLDAHHPYPGVVLDRHWNVVLANASAQKLVGLLPDFLKGPTLNTFRASLHPQGWARLTRNFDEWGPYLLQELQRAVARHRDPDIRALAEEVAGYPNVQALKSVRAPAAADALLVPVVLELHGATLSFFSTLTAFGTPRDITLDELCVELFYPSDVATEVLLRAA